MFEIEAWALVQREGVTVPLCRLHAGDAKVGRVEASFLLRCGGEDGAIGRVCPATTAIAFGDADDLTKRLKDKGWFLSGASIAGGSRPTFFDALCGPCCEAIHGKELTGFAREQLARGQGGG